MPIPNPDTRVDLAPAVLYWVPVIAPGNLMFYHGTQTFPQWDGNGFVGGMINHDAEPHLSSTATAAPKPRERWSVGQKRNRDVEEGPDGSLWMLEDANPGALVHVTPK